MLGMLLMLLEELEAGFQQALKLAVLRGGDQRRCERSVDGLMIGDFVLGIGFAPVLPACAHGSPELPKSADSGNLALKRPVNQSIGCRSKKVRR
jgi:hypothetical protein